MVLKINSRGKVSVVVIGIGDDAAVTITGGSTIGEISETSFSSRLK